MDQLIQCFPCKHLEKISIPRIHLYSQGLGDTVRQVKDGLDSSELIKLLWLLVGHMLTEPDHEFSGFKKTNFDMP